jgi:C-terminal processing protease CtpA/Prc
VKALLWLAACACASTPARPAGPGPAKADPPAKPADGPAHDPDRKRGELPDVATRKAELSAIQRDLHAMYAHREEKEKRYGIDEDAIFARAEDRIEASKTWMGYDAAIYGLLAAFHDSHLTYHPPQTAAPARGYTSFRLGLTTVLAKDRLLVATSELTGVSPGDEVIAIDGEAVAHILQNEIGGRAVSRPESAMTSYAKTWTSVLYPKGDAPRARTIRVRDRSGAEHDVAITPHEATGKHEVVSVTDAAGIAVVSIKSLEGGKPRAKAIDETLAKARGSKAIVVDLRGDRGGVDLVGYRIVAGLAAGKALIGHAHILAPPETIARRSSWQKLAVGSDGWASEDLTVDGLDKPYTGKVAVLVDAGCVSTCEVVAAALRADVHAVLVGVTTGGSSGAPVAVTLPTSRGSIEIPTWNLTSAEGKPVEGDGVVPDVEVIATPDALAAGTDLPLQTALDRLRASP